MMMPKINTKTMTTKESDDDDDDKDDVVIKVWRQAHSGGLIELCCVILPCNKH